MGLLDALLASLVLSALLLWSGQIVGNWADGRALASEARAVAELARAGRLLVEGGVTHPRREHPVGAAPLNIDLASLEARALRNPAAGTRTPGRRDLSLWLYRPSSGALLVVARARGGRPLSRVPSVEDGASGVGALLPGFGARLIGPGVSWDMAALNAVQPGFARENDLFALDYVALDVTCHSYLYRVAVDCDGDGTDDPDANTMTVNLRMDSHDIENVGHIDSDLALIDELKGSVTFDHNVSLDGEVTVNGQTTLNRATVDGTLTARQNMEIGGTLTVQDITASGTVTGSDLVFDGTLTVSGNARFGDADVGALDVTTLTVDQLAAGQGAFTTEVIATDVTTTRCTGCRP